LIGLLGTFHSARSALFIGPIQLFSFGSLPSANCADTELGRCAVDKGKALLIKERLALVNYSI